MGTIKLRNVIQPYAFDNIEDERINNTFRDIALYVEQVRKTYAPAFIGFKRDVDARLKVEFLNGDDVNEVDVSNYDDYFVSTKGVEFTISSGHLILNL